jgi:HEAT repeat protein
VSPLDKPVVDNVFDQNRFEQKVLEQAIFDLPVDQPVGRSQLSAVNSNGLATERGTPGEASPDPGTPTPGDVGPGSEVADICVGNFHDRWDASRRVVRLGNAALVDLLAVLQDDTQDWEARWFAARALGEFNQPEVIATLIQTFAATPDDDLRQAVAAALSQIGPPAIAALGEQLAVPTHRLIAVQALARIPHPTTLPLLLTVVDDPRSPVRATAIAALGAFADPTTLPVMQRGLEDPAAPVRSAAIRGLISLRSYLSTDQLLQALTPRLEDLDGGVAQQAVYALGRLSVPAAAAPLVRVLQRPLMPEPLQRAAVQALLWQGTAPALEGIISQWNDFSDPLRLALVKGLSAVAPDLRTQITPALVRWLHALPQEAAHSSLRCHLVLALGQIGTAALEPELRSLLQDPDLGVQFHAEAALRQLQILPPVTAS